MFFMSEATNMDALLTLEEAAERLRTPVSTLRFWRYQSTGPKSARIGRRVLYRESDISAWIEARYAAPREP